ncbi:hypothetical protein H5162_03795 [Pseudoalteromonas sp. SR41-8]|uniref:hypothetical protein n=1 Tax=Pseudoalteromonas sp. SR41-8 TaxID=2760946 RepID=UPI001603BB5F|nr:hypothetical protein [Pseudoalteromonas sp. SR41-8]MBB1308567.1 hypothetical protein [Pseudoalteromonas sp. SR41-8]
MNTHQAAERMLETGLFYTELLIAREFGQSFKHGEACLRSIRKNKRYTIIEEQHPVKKVKVIAIDGRTVTINQLQNTALLFKRPNILIQESSNGNR